MDKDKTRILIEDTYNKAVSLMKFIAPIKKELQVLQNNSREVNTQYTYEKRKDMWAELHTRVYKEVYYLKRVIVPGLKRIGIHCVLNETPQRLRLKHDIQNVKAMEKLYNKLFNYTNKRVFQLQRTALEILQEDNLDLGTVSTLTNAVELFDILVMPCVKDNYKHQHAYLGLEWDPTIFDNLDYFKLKTVKITHV